MSIKIDLGNFNSNVEFLKKTGLLKKGQKVLEIGTGSGKMLRYLKEQGHNVVGADVNDECIQFAKDRFGIEVRKLTDKNKLPFKDNSFDIILSFDVLEHIPDTDIHLQEVKRVLKPGGYYLLTTPNKLTNLPYEIWKKKSFTEYKKYHMSLHAYWGLKSRFEKHGFSIQFINIKIMNEYFKKKVKKYFGNAGLFFFRIFNPDYLPMFLKTNFYLVGNHPLTPSSMRREK